MKKRILFVEDNAILLEMYAMMLEHEQERWEVALAEDAKKALEIMEQSTFDVIISDMRMPGLGGVELLGEVRKRHPHTSRIIVSGTGDQQEVARSIGATHQFLAKPFTVKTLKATLARICGLDAYLKDEKLKSLVGQLETLPSFPTLYLEVMKALESDDSSLENLAEIIAKDPGMTTKMLQIANSAALGSASAVHSPFDAIQHLGINTVRSLAISVHVFSCFERTNLKGFSVNELWNHLMQSGALARQIMLLEGAGPADAEDAQLAGMLHDMGKLMLANNLPEQFQQALDLAAERRIPLHEAEREVFGATHAGVAAYLLGLWGLPAAIVEAVAFHHTPGQAELREFTPLTAVHAANVLVNETAGAKNPGGTPKLDLDYLASLGVEDHLESWKAEAAELAEAQTE